MYILLRELINLHHLTSLMLFIANNIRDNLFIDKHALSAIACFCRVRQVGLTCSVHRRFPHSVQYHDRRKPEVKTIPYSFRNTSRAKQINANCENEQTHSLTISKTYQLEGECVHERQREKFQNCYIFLARRAGFHVGKPGKSRHYHNLASKKRKTPHISRCFFCVGV